MRNLTTYLMILPIMTLALLSCNKKTTATGVELNKQSLEMRVDETAQLIATIVPAEAESIPVTWETSDEKIASVSENGLVTAVAAGEATITAKAGKVTASCSVKVSDVAVEGITLSTIKMTLHKGESETISVEIQPEEAQEAIVTFASSDENIATVDQSGKVTAVNVGEATISVSAGDITEKCSVNVIPKEVTSIKLDITEAELVKTETLQLTATLEPANSGATISWTTSNYFAASADENGLVTATGIGETVITATVGELSATCAITVLPLEATSITLNSNEVVLDKGSQFELICTVLPAEYDSDITYMSSDESVATVVPGGFAQENAKATITAINSGTTTITASIDGVSATCEVTVNGSDELAIGDFYYSDGTTSSELDPGKTPIGIVYWLGDPSVNDAKLKKDHPECTNGLVMALDESAKTMWWSNSNGYLNKNGGTPLFNYLTVHYQECSIIKQGGEGYPSLQNMQGYNNTKALEWFNAQPENAEWMVEAATFVAAYREEVPTPENTSGWYIPSPKELSLCCTGEFDGDLMGMEIFMKTGMRDLINDKLAQVEGATLLPAEDKFYWTSSMSNNPTSFVVNWSFAWVSIKPYHEEHTVRHIFAF